ncbi:CamS family sex pheromone protein [Faecalibaculum rodentium]|uniref:CamS family sex pheromone protein n=1 Tax=Faecalibaculum rodentium TaxID=1702221 RepID=UPI0023F19385|nr:CamS family sex pheromone protein [Faecalibaculum rodentium]
MSHSRVLPSLALTGVLVLSGCQADSTTAVQAEYEAAQPFVNSDTPAKHVGLLNSEDVRFEAERGLMDLSRQYFPPSDVTFRTHTFLDFDELDATDGSRGLLGTLRDDNPNGLNPNNNESFDTGNGVVQGAIILVDVYEVDWYRADSLAGISLSLVVNDSVTQNGESHKIGDEQLRSYIEVTSNKLVTYMRERFNEVSSRIPILVAAYELDSGEAASNGGYVMEGWYPQGSTGGKFTAVKETTLTVPSSAFTEQAGQLAQEFNTFKDDVRSVLADNTFVTGTCRMLNGEPSRLDLTITTHGKMLSEVMAAAQKVESSFGTFTDTDVEYHVTIINNDQPYAMGRRMARSTTLEFVSAA